jgi:nitroreductase/Pyruvate/2-oxoacid:ferredoxin oxidoreductase delta subunit
MPIFTANTDKCTQCGACIAGCPRMIIQENAHGFPFVLPEDEYYCMQCSHCVVNCAYCAASFGDYESTKAIDLKELRFPTPEESRKLLCTRRSARRFKPDSVNRETLQKVFEIVRFAPSASNRQPVRWIVAKNETLLKFKHLYLQRICEGKTSLGRFSRQEEQQKQGKDSIFRGAPLLIVAVLPESIEIKEDAAIAVTYLELAAHSLGLATMWSGVSMRLLRKDKEARELLGIKDDEFVGGAMLLGYSALPLSSLLPNKKQLDIIWLS